MKAWQITLRTLDENIRVLAKIICVVGIGILIRTEYAFAQRFVPLGFPPGDNWQGTEAWDVSDNGNVVVGKAYGTVDRSKGFRWVAGIGMETLPPNDNIWMIAEAISSDGTTIVGSSTLRGQLPTRGVYWDKLLNLNYIYPCFDFISCTCKDLDHFAEAHDISGNAQWIAGKATVSANPLIYHAARWRTGKCSTIPDDLKTLGGLNSTAFAISADGTVVVGTAQDSEGRWLAFRWTSTTGMQSIGALCYTEFGPAQSSAWGVSYSGKLIVGEADACYPNGWHAFLWDETDNIMMDLGTLPGRNHSHAYDVSNDGIVVGESYNLDSTNIRIDRRAFIWTKDKGMQCLQHIYRNIIPPGWELWAATAISPDGRYIVGFGMNPERKVEAFLLDTWAR